MADDDPFAEPGTASPDGHGGAHTAGQAAHPLSGDAYAPQSRMPAMLRRPVVRGVLVYLLLSLLCGAVAGLVWNWVVALPSYTVATDGSMHAATSERGLTRFFATDAWFCLIGAVLGLAAGILAWKWFRRTGWVSEVLAVVASTLAALMCWWVGTMLGPHGFAERLAATSPGGSLPIDFALHTWTGVLVWPFCATIPVLLWSSLGRDEQAGPARAVLGRMVHRRPSGAGASAVEAPASEPVEG